MNVFKARLVVMSVLVMAAFALIIVRLFTIQIIHGKEYAKKTHTQTHQRIVLNATRGRILDHNGTILAQSIERQGSVSVDAAMQPRWNADTTHKNNAVAVKRVYTLGEASGPVVGYVGGEGAGLGGIEFSMDRSLHGEAGWAIVQKDGRNKRYRKSILPQKIPENGADVYLTLDATMQQILYGAVKTAVDKCGALGGMGMIMDPATGAILAMVSLPSFNPNIVSYYAVNQRQNKCVSTIYEPGSTFKALTAALALTDHVVRETDTLNADNGIYQIYHQTIRDHKAYQKLTFAQALAYSSNVCFAKVAQNFKAERFYQYSRDFGLGDKSGIELPGEEAGILNPVDKWSGRTKVTMAIGQEISVTLLQMMTTYAAIANGGILVKPRICEKIVAMNGRVSDSSSVQPIRRVMSAAVAARLRTMMAGVVTEGTGMRARTAGVPVAGKTGTSQKICDDGAYSSKRVWSSFFGFTPVETPVLLCGIVIDEPANGEEGGIVAAPAFGEVVRQIVSNPSLSYAERIVGHKAADTIGNLVVHTVPSLCGLTPENARQKLEKQSIACQIIGKGSKVLYQVPCAGAAMATVSQITLYTVRDALSQADIIVPDCSGKSLSDAVNMLSVNGLKPFIIGTGRVTLQRPLAQSHLQNAQPCTLFCSFEG